MYWDKILPIVQVTFQEVVGGAHELLCAYACVLTIAQMYQNFTVQKNSQKNFRQRHALAKLAKIFSWLKFPRIGIYFVCNIMLIIFDSY